MVKKFSEDIKNVNEVEMVLINASSPVRVRAGSFSN